VKKDERLSDQHHGGRQKIKDFAKVWFLNSEDSAMRDYLISCSIPESEFLRDILVSSPEFKKFYETERTKITSPLIWIHNEKLRQGDQIIRGRLAELRTYPTGNVGIIIHNNPAQLSDVTIIAHELAHEIIREEGFPLVGQYHGCDDRIIIHLGFTLNNMIHDPLVIIKLQQCGFNLREEYQNECLEALEKYSKKERYAGIRSILLTFLYVQHLLENEILFPDSENPCTKLVGKIEEFHPECIAKGKQIYEFIKTNGFNSGDKVKRIYEKIYEIYPDLRDLTVIYD
jgi:hypothetical protein